VAAQKQSESFSRSSIMRKSCGTYTELSRSMYRMPAHISYGIFTE
jgi:hypothetical protein